MTQQAVTPLSYSDVQTWLQSLFTADALKDFPVFFEGPFIQEMPNQICTITLSSGAGYSMEGAADQPQFQVRIRSDQNAQDVAETNAYLLDKLIFEAKFPTKLASGMNLLLVSRVGGQPAPLGPPDQAYRFDYTCNYYAVVGVSR